MTDEMWAQLLGVNVETISIWKQAGISPASIAVQKGLLIPPQNGGSGQSQPTQQPQTPPSWTQPLQNPNPTSQPQQPPQMSMGPNPSSVPAIPWMGPSWDPDNSRSPLSGSGGSPGPYNPPSWGSSPNPYYNPNAGPAPQPIQNPGGGSQPATGTRTGFYDPGNPGGGQTQNPNPFVAPQNPYGPSNGPQQLPQVPPIWGGGLPLPQPKDNPPSSPSNPFVNPAMWSVPNWGS